jgi:hypothetical protein
MNEQMASTRVRATPETVRRILLQPLAFPDWNPAFLSMQGPPKAIVGQTYSMRARPGLAGTFEYTRIEDALIGISWQVPGLREVGSWQVRSDDAGTVVTHEFSQQGSLARLLSGAFRGVADLRLERLADRASAGAP